MRMLELDSVDWFDSAVEEAGKAFVSTELGGGTATAASIAIAERGVHGFLAHAGVIVHGDASNNHRAMILPDMPDDMCYTTSEHSDLLECAMNQGTP